MGVLDDRREAVRNAGLLLLVDLTSGANEDLRKIVAFEDVFGKTFALIQAEGGLGEAGITAQDCLSLLANLIKGSASNQTMFRESGCVSQMVQLLKQAFPPGPVEAAFIATGREKATWGLLRLLDLFLVPGESSTAQNQTSFFRAGIAQVLSDIAFSDELPPAIRSTALDCAASTIEINPPLQEAFAGMTVVTRADASTETLPTPQVNGSRSGTASARASARPSSEKPRTYIIEALLELTLAHAHEVYALRAASCRLIQAYLSNHDRVKAHFMQRALAGHSEGETNANALSTLLQPGNDASAVTFASWIVSDLIADQPQAKAALAQVNEGNETEGEDVLTAVQVLGAKLQSAFQTSDERIISAYASLLSIFAWEFADGVNELLNEGSGLVQALVAGANPRAGSVVIAGLAAVLLGTIYEFSTKDSPIPRRTLAPLLAQKLGRHQYLEALVQLRRDPAIRDAILDEAAHGETVLSTTFVDLFTVEYARLRKAIDKDPGLEVLPSSAAEAGVDRDVLDDLRQQLQSTKDVLSQTQQEALAAGQQHDQDRMSTAKELQTATAEVERLRRINQAMQQGHESELEKIDAQHQQYRQAVDVEQQRALVVSREESDRRVQAALRERETEAGLKIQELERRIAELGNAHRTEQSGHASTRQQLEALTARHAEVATREKTLGQQLDDAVQKHQKLQQDHQNLQGTSSQASGELQQLQTLTHEQQQQIERLNVQLNELKEDLKGKDDELATERTGFSELEQELEAVKLASGAPGGKADASGRLEQQVAEAKEAEKTAKEELESMLLVMGDIEAQRDQYKAKIKELGGEVTDDEEDEEGEEQEDET